MPRKIVAAATWPDSAAANTAVVAAGPVEEGYGAGNVLVIVHNPSTVSGITVTPRARVTDRTGAVRTAALIDTPAWTVPAGATQAKRVPSMIGAPDLSLVNASALGVGQGFTAEVVIQYE